VPDRRFARERFDALASMVDAVALLDMCHSFADCVASSNNVWCRPVVADGGSLAIREGRFAIDKAGFDYVSNDTFAGPLSNFTLISGVNGGGKSTYLKQIGIITVLAQIGSYVPAEEAFIPLRDLICTRIGTGDDFEHNMSSFMVEMKETSYICDAVKAPVRSLVLIDELGRATSNEDGVAIAWAVAEQVSHTRARRRESKTNPFNQSSSQLLHASSALTFFVTHYTGLAKLRSLYCNVTNLTFGRIENATFVSDHKVVVGSCAIASSYGIDMAQSCGWSKAVVANARDIRSSVMARMKGDGSVRLETGLDAAATAIEDDKSEILKRLCMAEQKGSVVTDDELKQWLAETYNMHVGEKRDVMLKSLTLE